MDSEVNNTHILENRSLEAQVDRHPEWLIVINSEISITLVELVEHNIKIKLIYPYLTLRKKDLDADWHPESLKVDYEEFTYKYALRVSILI